MRQPAPGPHDPRRTTGRSGSGRGRIGRRSESFVEVGGCSVWISLRHTLKVVKHPRTAAQFEWDDGNLLKLALRGVRPEDVEPRVLEPAAVDPEQESSDRGMADGRTR